MRGAARQLTWYRVLRWLYHLFSDTTFAIVVIIAIAVASILGLVVLHQFPFRGEIARLHYMGRQGDPWVWFLVNVVPERPFRCVFYRSLLALLSLSLLACTVRHWRKNWRLAFGIPKPRPDLDKSPSSFVWTVSRVIADSDILSFLRARGFRVRSASDSGVTLIAGSRFGISRLGSVVTHLGFLFLVLGGLWMGTFGFSTMAWMRPGDTRRLPGLEESLVLEDFRIERTDSGEISDYISIVRIVDDSDSTARKARIEVNHPLRYKGRSVYQSSYKMDPRVVEWVDILYDQPLDAADIGWDSGDGHTFEAGEFTNPVTVSLRPGRLENLPGTGYAIRLEEYYADFVVGQDGPESASDEPRNPAVKIGFYRDGEKVGEKYYFLRHPGMAVGSGPGLRMHFTNFGPAFVTGLEISTHPGSLWVWLGIVIMSIGTILSFILQHQRIWLRLSHERNRTRIAVVHSGASVMGKELATNSWEESATGLLRELLHRWPPASGRPEKWPHSFEE